MTYHIIGEWLCQDAAGCTCGSNGGSPHESLCGLEQVAKIADLLEADEALGKVTAEKYQWSNQISEALGMTDPEQWHVATLDEALVRIKEIIAARDSWRADVEKHVRLSHPITIIGKPTGYRGG